MENCQLQQLVEEISSIHFGKSFNHQARFNSRLRTTGGRYLLRSHDIEINKKYYDERGLEEMIGIIKHELCHYHLHIENKGYQHRDLDFKKLLKEVDAPRFCKPLEAVEKARRNKSCRYQCSACKNEYIRKRKIDINRYVCGKCRGRLFLIEETRSESP